MLFDLDGTLADTESMWQEAYRRLAAAHGVEPAPGWWSRIVGRDLGDAAVILLETTADTTERRDELVSHLVDEAITLLRSGATAAPDQGGIAVPWRPGAQRLLTALTRSGVPRAVVTATPRRLLDVVVDHLDIDVDLTLAGDEVARGKPDPEGYLRAAALLGVDIATAVVVEDSPTGVAAAEASGARVLVVPHAVPVADAATRTVVSSLEEVSIDRLASLPRQPHRTDHDPQD